MRSPSGRRQDSAFARLDILAHNTLTGFKLPCFDLTVIRLSHESVDAAAQVFGLNGAPNVDPLTK
jgi:hypothetical protein